MEYQQKADRLARPPLFRQLRILDPEILCIPLLGLWRIRYQRNMDMRRLFWFRAFQAISIRVSGHPCIPLLRVLLNWKPIHFYIKCKRNNCFLNSATYRIHQIFVFTDVGRIQIGNKKKYVFWWEQNLVICHKRHPHSKNSDVKIEQKYCCLW